MASRKRTQRKSYDQYCGLARSLDVVGERWTLLIVRNLLLGPRRYTDLLEELPGITTNLLAKRLRELEELGLLEKEERPPPVPATVYRLTDLGAQLEPAVMELARWGSRFLGSPRPNDTVNIGWGLLSMKRRYRGGLDATVEFRIGARPFTLTFSRTYLRVEERACEGPELRVSGSLEAFQGWLFRGTPLHELRARGALQACGDEGLLEAVKDAFGLT